ncbi:Predicted transcriptional regulators containing the CopG/Arc/MetJ DNA-binding domain [Enterobacter hormaechei]|uniref:DUF1173 family protein n=1 Tax=Enterobacter hormaechei TaxID=158836 RepID=UPI00125BD59B|nr:DUF1173 family protein [Enterobacter hormaechei]VAE23040.1 Predicted transcriptional regulators containing the CopG/Arc/MetJ DNA-binding domain [Enterobacter hormaechei]VAE27652.1 Predicted transcriptional regulators containing the CopG/Arc/MetJ DNA-binding domain [Enterobacter hormaechei]
MGQKFAVVIQTGQDVKRYSPEFQTRAEHAAGWKSTLQRCHPSKGANAVVTCGCRGKGRKLLSIHYTSASDTYRLAKYPGTGMDHEPGCDYFALDKMNTGLKGYQDGVVREDNEGFFVIRLSSGLKQMDPAPQDDCSPAPPARRPADGQSSMTLLGLLHLLWNESGLNCWHPAMAGKRTPSLVRYKLNEVAQRVRSGRNHLSNSLLVGKEPRDKHSHELDTITRDAEKNSRRLILLSPLARYDPARHEPNPAYIPFKNFIGMPLSFITSASQWQSVVRRFPSEIAAWKAGGRVVAIALTTPPVTKESGGSSNTRVKTLQIALMHVSDNWIPLDSGYEKQVAEKLDTEQRQYIKPMRYDASESEVFPDFVLLDCGVDKPVPMEVFGMNTPSYLARKELKVDYYNRRYGQLGWWYWDAAVHNSSSEIPDFPTKFNRC